MALPCNSNAAGCYIRLPASIYRVPGYIIRGEEKEEEEVDEFRRMNQNEGMNGRGGN